MTRKKSRAVKSTSGRSLFLTGFGAIHLPDSLADLEWWRKSCPVENEMVEVIADALADAIVTGTGVVKNSDLDHLLVIHWPDGKDQVIDARDMAATLEISERKLRAQLASMCRRGLLEHCQIEDADDPCGDGGYRCKVPRGHLLAMVGSQ